MRPVAYATGRPACSNRKIVDDMKKMIIARITGIGAGALALLSVAACGGSGADSPTATRTSVPPTNTPTAKETATKPPATPTVTPSATSGVPTQPAGNGDEQLIALGKNVFENTAGGVGCAYCHHADATGDTDIGSPNIRGVTEAQINDALATRAQMAFITLTNEEIRAVAAYLKTLAEEQ
jgi:mono/diheme cytochrome c family protein